VTINSPRPIVNKQQLTEVLLRQVGTNTVWLLLARIGSQGVMLLFSVVVARALGETGLGQYAFVAAVLFVGNVLTTFGMDTLIIREVAQSQRTHSAPLANALILQLGLSIIFIGVIFITAVYFPNQSSITRAALRLYSFSLIPLALTTVYSAALRGFEQMRSVMLINITTAVLQTVGAVLIFTWGSSLVGLIWVLLLAQSVTAVFAARFCHQHLPDFHINWHLVNWESIRKTAVLGSSLALLMVTAVIYQRIAIFALSFLTGDADTGWFSAAARLVEAAKMGPYALFGALFPIMARQQGQKTTVRSVRYAFGGSLLYAVVATMGFTAAAPWLIPFLYGETYAPTFHILQILAWSLLPFAATLTLSFDLVARHGERQVLTAAVWSLGITAVLALTSFRLFNTIGVAWAVVAGEVVQAVLLLILWNK
jgi:O-antigen/teichoic acid export membrane protein